MTFLSRLGGAARSLASPRRNPTDPRVIRTGASSLDASDRLAKGLGWFSIGLGALEMAAPRLVTGMLGLRGGTGWVRLFGLREIGTGLVTLSPDKPAGLWMRVAGDVLDIAAVLAATRRPSRRNFWRGDASPRGPLLMLAGVLVVDLAAASLASAKRSRALGPSSPRGTRERRELSGFPQGVEAARGGGRDATIPADMRAAPQAAV